MLADPRAASGFRSQWKEMVYPIVTVRSRGSKLWDVDGNEYIDLVNGFGPILFGHAPDFVTEAVAAQLKAGFETGPSTPLAGECAELVCELTGNERTTFCNTGSEAVMAAMRLARTVTARKKVVLFTGDYHGTFDEVLVKGVQRGYASFAAASPRHLPRGGVATSWCWTTARRRRWSTSARTPASWPPSWSSRCRAATLGCGRSSSSARCARSPRTPGPRSSSTRS